MNKNIKASEILRNKTVLTMTGDELLELLQQLKGTKAEEEVKKSSVSNYPEVPQFVTGIKDLGRLLNVSPSTVNRWKSEGLLDDVTFQNGKFVSFNVHGVLDILRVSNQKSKFNNKK